MFHCCAEWEKMILQDNDFFDLWSAHKYPLIELFHLSSLLQIPNDGKMVNIESFGDFSRSKRISFDDALSWLSISDGRPLCSSSSRLSSPLQNFLNHHCTVRSLAVPGPSVLLTLWVVSAALQPILNLKLFEFAFCLTSFLQSTINVMSLAKKKKKCTLKWCKT